MKKALITLALVIAITETLIMLLLAVTTLDTLGSWLPALFDALIVSLIAIITVKIMVSQSLVTIRDHSSEWIQIKIGAIVFGFEALVMLTLDVFTLPIADWQTTLFDTIVLTLGASLAIYTLVLKPASKHDLKAKQQKPRFDITVSSNLLGYALLMTLLLMVLISTYEKQYQKRKMEIVNHEMNELALIRSSFLEQLNHVALDALLLASQIDLQELMQGNRHSLPELQNDYQTLVRIKDFYDQARFLDETGKEIIRIQRVNNHVSITPANKLQDKSTRYYFQEGMALQPGEIFISPMDLNIENNVVEIPYKPMIRIVTPVADRHGIKSGVIVINFNANKLLDKIAQAEAIAFGQLMLLDENGYWLYGNKTELLWAFMFKDKSKLDFSHSFPETWKELKEKSTGSLETPQGTFIVENVEYDTEKLQSIISLNKSTTGRHWPIWKLVSHIPDSLIEEQMRDTRKLLILLYIIILITATIGTALLTQAMLKRRTMEQEIRQLAFYDSLTGLVNRQLFHEKLVLEMSHARRDKTPMALMYLDLDNFKPINDELGHDAGDFVLQEVADRLRQTLRETDTIARLGGDEFAIILPKSGSEEEISIIAQRLIDTFIDPFLPQGHECYLGISIGIDLLVNDDKNADELVSQADKAMYRAKQSGRNCYRYATQANG
ncbi:MAG: sensor domain-containing diguanylate cyclase [Gammaproteobacteria bacterium]|nr:sensor domain-containing diguanylate cyclase [Gammaproteobacteria bacterium]